MNKNFRPYVVSIDWLQLHLHRSSSFTVTAHPVGSLFCTNPDDWTFSDAGHGSKTYACILKVKHKSEAFGELSLIPYSAVVNELSCTLKIDNKLLYQPNTMQLIADFMDTFGFSYMGVSRLDLAYDCNEFYGGLTAEHLLKKYEKGDIVKYGAGSGYRQFKQGYNCSWDSALKSMSLMTDVVLPKQTDEDGNPSGEYAQELERQEIYADPECLISLPEDRNPLLAAKELQMGAAPIIYTSTTWGSRSSGHQVQIYNKTIEMQQVKYKHHIAQRWAQYGLDLNKDVWRVEIRITKGAKLVENLNNGTRRFLDPRDLILEEQIEQLFWDYAWKYFRFLSLDKKDRRATKAQKMRPLDAILAHKSRLKVYPVLCLASRNSKGELTEPRQQKFVPRVAVPQQDYSRSIKIAMNVIEGALWSAAKNKNPDIVHLQETYRELSRYYGLAKREISDIKELKAVTSLDKAEYPIFTWYLENWPEVQHKWFEKDAHTQAVIAWGRVLGHAKTKVQAELLSFGYSVPLQYVDEAIEHLLDDGHIPDYMVAGDSVDLMTDTPIEYNPDDLEYSLHWDMLENSIKHHEYNQEHI